MLKFNSNLTIFRIEPRSMSRRPQYKTMDRASTPTAACFSRHQLWTDQASIRISKRHR